jgi:hypothetical protein
MVRAHEDGGLGFLQLDRLAVVLAALDRLDVAGRA